MDHLSNDAALAEAVQTFLTLRERGESDLRILARFADWGWPERHRQALQRAVARVEAATVAELSALMDDPLTTNSTRAFELRREILSRRFRSGAPLIIRWLYVCPKERHRWPYVLPAGYFGDYHELITGSLSYERNATRAPYPSDRADYEYDISPALAAVAQLARIPTTTASNLLHDTGRIIDIEVRTAEWCGEFSTSGTLDFSPVRAAARTALAARGNPPYVPERYAREDAWRR